MPGEKPVAKRVHKAPRIDDLRHGLGEPGEQRIETRWDEVRAEAARDGGERSGDSSSGCLPAASKISPPSGMTST